MCFAEESRDSVSLPEQKPEVRYWHAPSICTDVCDVAQQSESDIWGAQAKNFDLVVPSFKRMKECVTILQA